MWSHYASSHEGICIEYDFKDYFQNNNDPSTLLHEVIYSDNRVTLDATILDRIDIKDIENRGKFDILEFFWRACSQNIMFGNMNKNGDQF